MPINMGIGRLGGDDVIHKRKFRWTFAVERNVIGGGTRRVPASFVKVAARPNIEIEEVEINFLNAKTYIPGKGTWQSISITYFDVSVLGGGAGNEELWSWLASVYNFTDNVGLGQSSIRRCYGGTGIITLYDGCGNDLEQWRLFDCWPQAVNFGELDYSQSEEVTIDVTLRYSNVRYTNLCGPNPQALCCGCGPGNTGGTGTAVN
jgi:hypothetical protein